MKQAIKIYMESEDVRNLILKCNEAGFIGRGCLSKYMTKISRESICFLDNNVKAILEVLNKKK